MWIKLYIQSTSDVITNSSTELFCVIQGIPEIMKEITEYLESMGCSIRLNEEGYRNGLEKDSDDLNSIYFDLEYGEGCSLVANNFVILLKNALSQFDNSCFEILEDVSW